MDSARSLTSSADATGEVVENALARLRRPLATLDRCADVPTLRAVIRPPDDPATLAKVTELRKRLAEAKARFDAGRWKETLKEVSELISQARVLGYKPVVAESLALLGMMKEKADDGRAAESAFVEAYRLADASRHDEVRAEVSTMLVFVVGDQEGNFAEAQTWFGTANSVARAVGGAHSAARVAVQQPRLCIRCSSRRHSWCQRP